MKSSLAAALILLALCEPGFAQEGKGSEGGERAATVAIVNELDRDVTVWVNGEMKGVVEAKGTASFAGVPSGRVSLQAGSVGSGGPVAGEDRDLAPGETFTWTLYPVLSWGEEKGTGTVVVRNALDHEVQVFLGESVAGTLAPGASRAYPRIVAGDVTVSARDPEGKTIEEERNLTVSPGRIARWEIGKAEEVKARKPQKASRSRNRRAAAAPAAEARMR